MLHLRRHHRPQVSTRYGQGRFRGGGPRLRGFGGEGSRGRSGERCRTIHATQHQTASVSFPPSSSPGGSCRPTHISRYAETQPCHPLPPGRLNPRTSRNSVETSRNITSFTSKNRSVSSSSQSLRRFRASPSPHHYCACAHSRATLAVLLTALFSAVTLVPSFSVRTVPVPPGILLLCRKKCPFYHGVFGNCATLRDQNRLCPWEHHHHIGDCLPLSPFSLSLLSSPLQALNLRLLTF